MSARSIIQLTATAALAIATIGATEPPRFDRAGATSTTISTLRIRAAGLDPASPSFAADVRARLAQQRSMLEKFRTTTTLRIAPTTLSKFSPQSILRFTGKAGIEPGTPGGAGAGSTSSHSKYSENAILHSGGAAAFLGGSSQFNYVQLDDGITGSAVDTSKPLPIPAYYIFVVSSPSKHLAEPGYGTMTMNVPDCNVTISSALERLWDPTIQPSDDNYYGWQLPAAPSGQYLYDLAFDGFSYPQGTPLAIGAKPHVMNVTYPSAGQTLTHSLTVVNTAFVAHAYDLAIDQNGAPMSDANLGVQSSNVAAGQPDVTRFNQGTTNLTGTDIVGRGISLGAGYSATAKIVSSSSIADANGNSDADNSYRGATVTVQPQAGRLETSVAWHISPFDSLQYVLEWTLTGPPGQRATLALPLGGPCDS